MEIPSRLRLSRGRHFRKSCSCGRWFARLEETGSRVRAHVGELESAVVLYRPTINQGCYVVSQRRRDRKRQDLVNCSKAGADAIRN